MAEQRYRVGELAKLAGVSVRTLHHYDHIGLLVPSARSRSDYRLYVDGDVLRLQQILIGRRLGLSLEAIRRELDDPKFDRRTALLEQRRRLVAGVERTHAMIDAIDAALQAMETNEEGKHEPMDIKKIFDGFDPEDYREEAESRWRGDDAYRIASQRTAGYNECDWARIKGENQAIMDEFAVAKQRGLKVDDPAVGELAQRHHRHIERWYYPCSPERHAALARMYVADPRFTANIDKTAQGLAEYLSGAILTLHGE